MSKVYYSVTSMSFPVNQELAGGARMFRVLLDFAFFEDDAEVADYVTEAQHVRYFPIADAEDARKYVEYVCHHVREEIAGLKAMRDVVLGMNSGYPLNVLWDDWVANAAEGVKDEREEYPIIKTVSGGYILDLPSKAREGLAGAYDAVVCCFERAKIVANIDEDFELDLVQSGREDRAIVSLDFLREEFRDTKREDGKTFLQFLSELEESDMRQYL